MGTSNNIQDQVVVITGGSSGLGEATARHLAGLGAKLVLGARRQDRLDTIVTDIVAAGGQAIAVKTDVTRRDDLEALVAAGVEKFGRIDVLINNAGTMPLAPLNKLKVDEWESIIDINIKGVLYGIAAALPRFEAQGSGHFINLSSVAGHKVLSPMGTVYSASKFAVLALSEGLRAEVGSHIRTTVISPARSIPTSSSTPPIRRPPRGYRRSTRPRRFQRTPLPERSPMPSNSRTRWTSTKFCCGRPRRSCDPAGATTRSCGTPFHGAAAGAARRLRACGDPVFLQPRTARLAPDVGPEELDGRHAGESRPPGPLIGCCIPATRQRPYQLASPADRGAARLLDGRRVVLQRPPELAATAGTGGIGSIFGLTLQVGYAVLPRRIHT